MLLPALSKAREKAREAVCKSNLKQIMLGTLMYVEDYDGYLPHHTTYWLRNLTGWDWNTQGYTGTPVYVPAKLIYSRKVSLVNLKGVGCPSDNNTFSPNVSYAMRYYAAGKKLDRCNYSLSKTFIFADSWLYNGLYAGNALSQPHSEGANFAFGDGHVEWFQVPEGAGDNYGTNHVFPFFYEHAPANIYIFQP